VGSARRAWYPGANPGSVWGLLLQQLKHLLHFFHDLSGFLDQMLANGLQ